MGSEDLFHKRKAKKAKDLQRREEYRQAKKRVLIVCEGETEVSYFLEAREHYKLNALDVEINNKGTPDPKNIVNFAKNLFTKARNEGNPFDLVFLVFDKDDVHRYNAAVQAIASSKPQNTFFAIGSVPRFEYWLLLHFKCWASHLEGAKTEIQLKKHMPDYKKNKKGLFRKLVHQLEQAKKNAKETLQACEINNTDNPSTRVHELIETLEGLKSPSR
jgi:hypothetical protein